MNIGKTVPALERILSDPEHSFRCITHDYPSDVARWNYHPEHEIHLIQQSRGQMFVGDYIGTFGPGNLCFVNSNVPHNWVSELSPGTVVGDRDLVIQFDPQLVVSAGELFPELRGLHRDTNFFSRSWEFDNGTAVDGAALMRAITNSSGVIRLLRFLELLNLMATSKHCRPLASSQYVPTLDQIASDQIEKVMGIILETLPQPVFLADLAEEIGMSPSAFSRFFQKNTGHNFVDYLRKLRIGNACHLLSETNMAITDICFEVGYANLSNFNRAFRDERGMPPKEYRRLSVVRHHKEW